MQGYSGVFGFVHFLTVWVMRLSVTNVLWFMINIPVTVILISYFLMTGETWIYLLPLLLFIPLFFFPSTAAMFAMARDWMRDMDHPSLVRSYLSYVKENYKSSAVSGFVWVILWGIWFLDVHYFSQKNDLFAMVLFLAGVLLFVMNIHFFSMSVHYQMTVRELIQNSFFMTIGRPLLTVGTGLICLFLLYASVTIWFLIVFFTGSLMACISFYLFYRSYLKLKSRA